MYIYIYIYIYIKAVLILQLGVYSNFSNIFPMLVIISNP